MTFCKFDIYICICAMQASLAQLDLLASPEPQALLETPASQEQLVRDTFYRC